MLSWQLDLPRPVRAQVDPFGNILRRLTLDEPHDAIIIGARGQVDIDRLREAAESRSAFPFLRCTRLTEPDEALRAFAEQHCHQRRDRTALIDLMHALHQSMNPRAPPKSTPVPPRPAGAARACARTAPMRSWPARAAWDSTRYVSGYLCTEDSTHLASHAWAETWPWTTPGTPAPASCSTGPAGTAFETGRGPGLRTDACPVRGMRRGGGHEQMHAQVFVALPSPAGSLTTRDTLIPGVLGFAYRLRLLLRGASRLLFAPGHAQQSPPSKMPARAVRPSGGEDAGIFACGRTPQTLAGRGYT